MCDSRSTNITYQEPNAIFWSSPNCSGRQMELTAGEYPNLDNAPITNGIRIGINDIDSMWIPPNMTATVYDSRNFGNQLGTYSAGLYSDLNNPRLYAGRNQIDSIKITRKMPWIDHLTNCCTGKVSNGATPQSCGMFWGKGNDLGLCDDLMETYCKNPAHQNDAKCSCYGVPVMKDDPLDVRLIKAQPKCWSEKCATYGYLPSNMVKSPCPDVKICKQDIRLPGSNNIVRENQYIQDCSDRNINSSSNPSSGSSSGSSSNSITNINNLISWARDNKLWILVIIIVFIVFQSWPKSNTQDNKVTRIPT